MNVLEANKIQIINWLQNQNFNIFDLKSNNAWFNSPLHPDKTASFKVELNKNVWYDYSLRVGGGLIDLVMKLHNTDVSGALKILSTSKTPSNPQSTSKTPSNPQSTSKTPSNPQSFSFDQSIITNQAIQIKHLQSIQNKALIQYLQTRKIPFLLANNYLSEAYYTMKDKQYFALAFKNDSGGFELRNKYFKGCTSPKTYTLIDKKTANINVFEGFFDFLSAMVYYNLKQPRNTTIILNGIGFINQIDAILNKHKIKNLYLDNDKAGTETSNELTERNQSFINQSKILYPEFKDFNKFLTNP